MPDIAKIAGYFNASNLEDQELTADEDGATLTENRTGIFDALLASYPRFNTIHPSFPGLALRSVNIKPTGGGAGRMTLIFKNPSAGTYGSKEPNPDPDPDLPEVADPEITLDFVEVVMPIESHPSAPRLNEDATAANITWADWPKLCENGTTDGDIVGLTPRGDEGAGFWNPETFIAKKLSGVESFWRFLPVIRRTVQYFVEPPNAGRGCGQRETPPVSSFEGVIADFDWLKATETCVRSGFPAIYTLTTEWRGSDRGSSGHGWDPDIYSAIAPPD